MLKGMKLLFPALILLTLIACQKQVSEEVPLAPTATRIAGTLVPYSTQTDQKGTQAPAATSPTLVPTPSPTPQVHVVTLDETMISIAYKYGITLEALQNANPEANPYAMIVGDELLIPYQEPVEEGSEVVPAPDPEPVELSETHCYPEASGGVWCLWTATSPDQGTENIIVRIQLGSGENTVSQVVPAPLNINPPGQQVPMGAFFSVEDLTGVIKPYQTSLTLLQALPLNDINDRYVPVTLEDGLITIKSNRSSATITGNLKLVGEATTTANSVWVVASAYNRKGDLIGFRRWTLNTPLSIDDVTPVEMQVFALDNESIFDANFTWEAHP